MRHLSGVKCRVIVLAICGLICDSAGHTLPSVRIKASRHPAGTRRSVEVVRHCRAQLSADDESLPEYLADPFAYILGEDDITSQPTSPTAQQVALGESETQSAEAQYTEPEPKDGMSQILFVECGFGCDQHGQNPTKAVVRACRNAIEFNSIPSIERIVPGGYDTMKLHVQVGVPGDSDAIDRAQVAAVFPYGNLLPIAIEQGGLLAKSGIVLPQMGDENDDMIIAVACVTVGY